MGVANGSGPSPLKKVIQLGPSGREPKSYGSRDINGLSEAKTTPG